MKTIYPYVEDEVFLREVSTVLNIVTDSLNEIDDDMFTNVIDPFSALFDAITQDLNYDDWIEQEKHRQLQKTLQNAIGYFHQNILGSVDGWINPGAGGGYDVENVDKKIFAEIKNKHNTFNANSSDATYEKIVKFLEEKKKGYVAYVVIIIPKKPRRYSKHFVPSGKVSRDDLLTVDGSTFYEMVTGDKNALKLLFQSIPNAVNLLTKNKKIKTKINGFFDLYDKAYGE